MSLRVGADFQGRWSAFWGTTYSFEHRLFDEYWFPRLGEPPLNATILVDANRLAETWAGFEGEEWRLRRVNRDYLVRGVSPTSGAFHPKTYFFGHQHEGVLLVGSGNLSLKGLEEGHEVFCRFTSRDEEGLTTIRQWREWMGRLVRVLDDSLVRARWADALQKTPWLAGAAGASSFVTNWDRPLLAQLVDELEPPVDELHLMAPFFDEEAVAVGNLVAQLQPRRVTLYLGRDASVDGDRLREAVGAATPDVDVYSFAPDRFVHAKLLGVVTRDAGRLLSGSANLSRAALLATVESRTGNVEAGVLMVGSAESVRGAFVPEHLELVRRPVTYLATLSFRPGDKGPGLPLTLRSATARSDGRIAVVFTGHSTAGPLFLAGSSGRQVLADSVTAEPFDLDENGVLVWLADAQGGRLSNPVPVDDPKRLAAWLQTRAEGHERPRELDPRDIRTPVGAMLERLHQECVFDVDETPAVARTRSAAQETDDADFWDRLMREELRLDPRADRYGRLRAAGSGDDDEVFRLLRVLLDAVPGQHRLHLLAALGIEEPTDGRGTGQPWSPDRRLQVRVYNLLDRWSRAIGDPRLAWINPLAPVRNYAALVGAVGECWKGGYLPADRATRLAETLFGTFIRTEGAPGYLAALTDVQRAEALKALRPEARSVAAAVAYAALVPIWQGQSSAREQVFTWQPFVVPGREWGVFAGDEAAARLAGVFVGKAVPVEDVANRLEWAACYIDDPHWCLAVQRELGLRKVSIRADQQHPLYDITIEVQGVADSLGDARLVALMQRALDYRHGRGIVLRLPDGRLSVHLGDLAYARFGPRDFAAKEPITRERLAEMQAKGAGWGAVLQEESRLVS